MQVLASRSACGQDWCEGANSGKVHTLQLIPAPGPELARRPSKPQNLKIDPPLAGGRPACPARPALYT